MKTPDYWHNKHPLTPQLYSGRPLPNGNAYDMDVRQFVWEDDIELLRLIGCNNLRTQSNDETAHRCQQFVTKMLSYVSDSTLGVPEYWMFPAETCAMKKGDCEDGAILIASLLLNALPDEHQWRVRVAAGWVDAGAGAAEGGHAYCVYCRCSDNEWIALDWCYLEDADTPVAEKTLVKDRPEYRDVWFSFNHRHAWSHVQFELKRRVKDDIEANRIKD